MIENNIFESEVLWYVDYMYWKYLAITLLQDLFMLWLSVSPSQLVCIRPQEVKWIVGSFTLPCGATFWKFETFSSRYSLLEHGSRVSTFKITNLRAQKTLNVNGPLSSNGVFYYYITIINTQHSIIFTLKQYLSIFTLKP